MWVRRSSLSIIMSPADSLTFSFSIYISDIFLSLIKSGDSGYPCLVCSLSRGCFQLGSEREHES